MKREIGDLLAVEHGPVPRTERRASGRPPRGTPWWHPGLLQQQSIARLVTCAAPASVASVIAGLRSSQIGVGMFVGACTFAAAWALERRRYPLHLMPLGGLIARALALLGGVVAALVISIALKPIPLSVLAPSVLGAWLALAIVVATTTQLTRRLSARVAVIGSAGLARSLIEELRLAATGAYEVVGWVDPWGSQAASSTNPRLLGPLDRLEEIVVAEEVDLLVGGALGSPTEGARTTVGRVFEQVSACCLRVPVKFIGTNQFFEELLAHVPLGTIDATWFQYVLHPRYRPASPRLKRVMGLILATMLLTIAAPFLALVAIAIKLEDGGPVFYRQRRVGERGREFELLKLRTMHVEAERDRPVQWTSASDDPRLTRVGRPLRVSHLDELPQLWNVVTGQMALVGPRPERPELVEQLEGQLQFYGRRHLMRPGITGWAQIRCGYAGSVSGSVWKLAHDLFYLKHRSLLFDAMILLETLAIPFRERKKVARQPGQRFVLEAIREQT